MNTDSVPRPMCDSQHADGKFPPAGSQALLVLDLESVFFVFPSEPTFEKALGEPSLTSLFCS